ncbi:MAG: triacylglycerol lipase [Nannocystaceae bacterium]
MPRQRRRCAPPALPAALLGLCLCACAGDDAVTSATAGSTSDATTGAAETDAAEASSAASSSSSGGSDSDSASGTTTGGTTTAGLACEGAPELVLRDLFAVGDAAESLAIAPCGADLWYFVGASESTLEITLRGAGAGAAALVAYPDVGPIEAFDEPLAPLLESAEGDAVVRSFAVPRSGEFALHVLPADSELGASYDLEIRCVDGCDRETTRFPSLWVHGWTGFENIGPLTYFFGVRDHLEPFGFPMSIAVLDPYNSSEVRGGQLSAQIDEALVDWRARKLDLIGHSQGGIDSRYAIASLGHGEDVSVLLTIATPHRGTYIMDLALGLAPGAAEEALAFLFNLLGAVSAQAQSDAKASFYSLSEAYMNDEFNPQNPDDPDVVYISYTGYTCAAIDFLDPDKHCDDYVDPLILAGYNILKIARGPNDGLVTVESAEWGDYRGEMIADHIDEVGQIAGITDADFDHRAWYLERIRDLAAEGH